MDVGDRKKILEDALEPDVLAVLRGGIQLQQRFERARLNVEQMGHAHALIELGERDFLHEFWHLFTYCGRRRQLHALPSRNFRD